MQESLNQISLFTHDGERSIHLIDVPIEQCRHSRFNTRKTRSPQDIEKLAARMRLYGFERTRALWSVEVDGSYEVFAGGTRLEAARQAGLTTIPVMLHVGYTNEEVSQRADLDNENDEYHMEVPIVDIWAEYARLLDEEQWIHERIAKAKGVDRPTVVKRLRFHGLSEKIKKMVCDRLLTEGHLDTISGEVCDIAHIFHRWLTAGRIIQELAEKISYDKSHNGSKTVSATRDDVALWKEFIAYAAQVHQSLPAAIQDPDDEEASYFPQEAFVLGLMNRQARSLPQVKAAEQEVRSEVARLLREHQRRAESESAEAAKAAAKAEAEQALMAKFVYGNGIKALENWDKRPIRLLLTDPPYGQDYQSNRRWRSHAPNKITGDTPEQAMTLLRAMLAVAVPYLADDSHVVIFCAAAFEPEVRQMVIDAGLAWTSHGIWLKDEHSAGDVECALGPDHECMVHAIKGRPKLSPRRAETFKIPRTHETSHPNEKPLALLSQLIQCMSSEGDLVVDPFGGCASTLIAALTLKRDFWGAEIDQTYHEEGTTRLLKVWEASCQ